MNDMVVNGTHRPVVYGIGKKHTVFQKMNGMQWIGVINVFFDFSAGVNVKTGDVFPSSFTYKGPAEQLRSARTFAGGQVAQHAGCVELLPKALCVFKNTTTTKEMCLYLADGRHI